MDSQKLLESLFDKKRIAMLKLFLQDKTKQFYLREISKLSNVPVASTFRILNEFVKLNLIQVIKIKKFKLYQAKDNQAVTYLGNFMRTDKQALSIFVDMIKNISSIELAISHGKPSKDRANVLIIGEDVNAAAVKECVGKIKEEHKFTISSLTLTKEQFDQMSAMGLYSGEKRIIYKK